MYIVVTNPLLRLRSQAHPSMFTHLSYIINHDFLVWTSMGVFHVTVADTEHHLGLQFLLSHLSPTSVPVATNSAKELDGL